ncbi:hypothetical protein C477_12142 [Haloterrigena salina JCM 13891]|uniref:Uncharacterized protein n=1 Tax=Haloterrigena salina JCM 13891 TaxID=1227488 RepID=M0C427_9EURY|nr:3'-5' exonuclease [Haloterrigena salina]ELZ17955.1 hypothetical protein C477_12142 [Haloterrigena salina JCM 13891]
MSTAPEPRTAFDIETINAEIPDDEEFDMKNSEHVEMFCICAAYQPEPAKPVDYEVFFREDSSPEAELDVIEETVQWLESKPGHTLLTYNGNSFDIPHLEERARIAAETIDRRFNVPERVESFLKGTGSVDLYPCVTDALGEKVQFEEACERFEIRVPETPLDEYEMGIDPIPQRPTYKGIEPVFKGCDVPVVGERYLKLADVGATDTLVFQEMRAALDHYATTDVTPLFELADRVPIVDAAN